MHYVMDRVMHFVMHYGMHDGMHHVTHHVVQVLTPIKKKLFGRVMLFVKERRA